MNKKIKRQNIRKNKFTLLSTFLAASIFGFSVTNANANDVNDDVNTGWFNAKQWVKVTNTKNLRYTLEILDLKSSIVNSTDESKVIKLSSTPFSTKGVIKIDVNLSFCTVTDLTQVIIPFESSPNGYLFTQNKNYQVVVDAYCNSRVETKNVTINVNVSGNPLSGYEIAMGTR